MILSSNYYVIYFVIILYSGYINIVYILFIIGNIFWMNLWFD